MKLLIYSDVHTEFHLPKLDVPEEVDVIILAGDIGLLHLKDKLTMFLDEMCSYGKPVLYVPGNHEYFHTPTIKEAEKQWKSLSNIAPNLYLMWNKTLTIGSVKFIGTPLWTNFDDNPVDMLLAKYNYSDFQIGPYLPADYISLHQEACEFISKSISFEEGIKNVVITHWPPVDQLVNPRYTKYNSFFNNRLDWIHNLPISLWVYGHNHHSDDVTFVSEGIRFVSNQVGYPREGIPSSVKIVEI